MGALCLAVMLLCAQGLHVHRDNVSHEVMHSDDDVPHSMHFGFLSGDEARPSEVGKGSYIAAIQDVKKPLESTTLILDAEFIPALISIGSVLLFLFGSRGSSLPGLSWYGSPPPARAPPL